MRMLIVIFVCFVIIVGRHTYKVYVDSGGNYEVPNKSLGYCRSITDIIGPEDLALAGNQVYISSNDNRMLGKNIKYPNGNIFLLNLENGRISLVEHDYQGEFHPHGIDYLESKLGKFLYVVNHKSKEDSILIFRELKGKLILYKEITDKEIANGNDVVAFDLEKFYMTRDHKFRSHIGRFIENFLRIGYGKLVFYNNGDVKVVREGIKFSNGLAIDKKSYRLYMAEMLGKTVHKFDITNLAKPKHIGQQSFDGAPDNIYLDGDHLYVATHNRVLDLKQHQASSEKLSPSTIYRWYVNSGRPEMIYSNDGTEIPAASVAIPVNDKIILGTIFERKLLICDYAKN